MSETFPSMKQNTDAIVEDLKKSVPVEEGVSVRYPGERAIKTRGENLRNGIPVNKAVWEEILSL